VIVDAAGDTTGAQLQTNALAPLLRLDGLPLEREILVRHDADTGPETDSIADPFTGHLGLTSVRVAAERIAAFLRAGPGTRLNIRP
jgi:hypothetical protein